MSDRVLTLDEFKERPLADWLREAVKRQETLTVRLPEGDIVLIRPAPRLKALPMLEGFVPDGWKEAVYE